MRSAVAEFNYICNAAIKVGKHSHIYTVFHKNGTTYFRLELSHFFVDFYNSSTNGNRNEYSTITCNLLT